MALTYRGIYRFKFCPSPARENFQNQSLTKKNRNAIIMKKPKFAFTASVEIFKKKGAFELADKTNHRTLGIWALECTERVMSYFEDAYPDDSRPHQALLALQEWIDTGAFSMKAFRAVALPAHAAAKEIGNNCPAASVAHAAGQAAGTAHGPRHCFGAANYALQAIYRATNDNNEAKLAATKEQNWQLQRLQELSENGGNDIPSSQTLWRG